MLYIVLELWICINLCYSNEINYATQSYDTENSTGSGVFKGSPEYEVSLNSWYFTEINSTSLNNFTDSSYTTNETLNDTTWTTLINSNFSSNTETSTASIHSKQDVTMEVTKKMISTTPVNKLSSSIVETSVTSFQTNQDNHLTSSFSVSSTFKDYEVTTKIPKLTQKSQGIYPMAVAGIALMAGLLTTFVIVLLFFIWNRKTSNLIYEPVSSDIEHHM